MLAVLSPEARFENYSGDQRTVSTAGIAEFPALAEKAKTLFSEREQRVTSLDPSDDGVAIAEITYRGRLAADVPGAPAAGAVLELRGRSEFEFGRGRISRIVDRS